MPTAINGTQNIFLGRSALTCARFIGKGAVFAGGEALGTIKIIGDSGRALRAGAGVPCAGLGYLAG